MHGFPIGALSSNFQSTYARNQEERADERRAEERRAAEQRAAAQREANRRAEQRAAQEREAAKQRAAAQAVALKKAADEKAAAEAEPKAAEQRETAEDMFEAENAAVRFAEEKADAEKAAAEKKAAEEKADAEKAAAEKKAAEEKADAEKAAAEKKAAEEKADAEKAAAEKKAAEERAQATAADELEQGLSEPLLRNACILTIGNPGTGKSMLLNRIARQGKFRAGLPPRGGKGYTTELQIAKDMDGNKLLDTIGIADVSRGKAIQDLQQQLNLGGSHKFIFVVVQAHGRIIEQERVTMKVILDAIPHIHGNYALIINQCEANMMKKVESDDVWRIGFLQEMFKGLTPTQHVHFMPSIKQLVGATEQDPIIPLDATDEKFIAEIPEVYISPGSIESIETRSFEQILEELAQAEAEIGDNLTTIEKAMQRRALEKKALQDKAKRNTCVAFLILTALLISTAPAVMTAAKLRDFDKNILFEIDLPPGGIVSLPTYLFPYMAVFILYKIHDAVSAFCKRFPDEFDMKAYTITGNTFFLEVCGKGGYIKNWHMFAFLQIGDLFSDADVLAVKMRDAPFASGTAMWGLCTLASLAVLTMYLKRRINLKMAIFLELVLEDIWQSLLSTQEILFLYNAGEDVSMMLISSSILAILGVLGAAGTVVSYLKD